DEYTAAVKKVSDGNFVITNSHTPETTDISGTKTWDDSNDQDGKRPEMITVHLLKDTEVIKTAKVTAANDWKYEFKNLPKYEDGEEINYTVAEDTVKDYSSEYKSTSNGFDITNSYTPGKGNINVVKVWKDDNDEAGLRPDYITFKLLADGKETGKTLKLTAKNDWQGSFEGLDIYQDGKEIIYTVEESNVKGYVSKVQ